MSESFRFTNADPGSGPDQHRHTTHSQIMSGRFGWQRPQPRTFVVTALASQVLDWLTGDRGDEVEVLVDGENSQAYLLSGRRNQQVGQ